LILTALAEAASHEPGDAYHRRRWQLASKHSDGAILLLGFSEADLQGTRSPFRQENNFYYLSGWNEAGAAMLLLPQREGGRRFREVLFLPAHDDRKEIWLGPRASATDRDARSRSGFMEVRPMAELRAELDQALKPYSELYTLLPHEPGLGQPPDPDWKSRLTELAPGRTPVDIRASITAMRQVKSAGEIALIRKAADATVAAHLAAWRKIRPGLTEYEVAAPMFEQLIAHGCLRPAYTPIIGTGFNASALHYEAMSARLAAGELVLIDVGGECGHYASDLTRTVPATGIFSERQRKLYELVLDAQKAALAAVKPGARLTGGGSQSLVQLVRDFFDREGKKRLGEPMSKYFTHGLGHHVGLEVHDPADSDPPLEPGMVITIEPGLYMPREKLGIRIEDMVVVTADGAEVLSAALPKEPSEIEKILAGVR
jgi:Xaa-Pro aminopeptidase